MGFTCKMCGSELYPEKGAKTVLCEACGSEQTLPVITDSQKTAVFNQANTLRLRKNFDKAVKEYKKIIDTYPEESEAYWCLLLSEYGIEYVDDRRTESKIPTCNRTMKASIFDRAEYKKAIALASQEEKELYEREAKEIDRLQKKILSISEKESPYDIFICFKDTDDNGKRTKDSQYASLIYDRLTEKGYKVFFSRVTLKSKGGSEYEPLIYSALQTAKVMLAVGSKTEYMEAVWVRNEWSRFLGFMEEDVEKALVPCLKGMDPYDMPEELQDYQALDMGELDFFENLLRSVDNKFGRQRYVAPAPQVEAAPVSVAAPAAVSAPVSSAVATASVNVARLLQRVVSFLEDKDWAKADEYCERVLDEEENAEAYLYKAMVALKLSKRAEIKNNWSAFQGNINYAKVMKYADGALKTELQTYASYQAEKKRLDEEERKHKEEERLKAEEARRRQVAEEKRKAEEARRRQVEEEKKKIVEERKRKEEEAKRLDEENRQKGVGELAAIRATLSVVQGKISAGGRHTAFVKTDGKVMASGDKADGQCDVSDWRGVAAVSAGLMHTVGLKVDGTVVATKYKGKKEVYHGQCDVEEWEDIVAVSAGFWHTVGLKKDGTVVAVGDNRKGQCNVFFWRDVVAVSAGRDHTVGLKKDGTVVAVGEYNACMVSSWKNIVAVSAGEDNTIGLQADGTCIAAGANTFNKNSVSAWRDIVAISAGYTYTVGLKKDGKVVAVGYEQKGGPAWTNIVAITAGKQHTIGLKVDGTMISTGKNDCCQGNVYSCQLFKDITKLSEEMEKGISRSEIEDKKAEEKKALAREKRKSKAEEKKKEEEKRAAYRAQGVCQYCGGTFKGIFGKKCSVCGVKKDY